MRTLVWFANGDRLECPLAVWEEGEEYARLCNGDCMFWCKLEDKENPEKHAFDCMLRLAVLKYLGLDYSKEV